LWNNGLRIWKVASLFNIFNIQQTRKGIMNLQRPNANEALETKNRSRDVAPQSGICSRCVDGCKGNCDLFRATFRGRELLYPQPFGSITAGADKDYPVDYSHLNINGYALGAKGIDANPDDATFPNVDTETAFGVDSKVKMKVPIFTGALGSTEIARKNWEHFAIGAAISGITLVCGENVCGIDPELEFNGNGKVAKSPEMDRWVQEYRRYHEGYGDILVQLNVEDTRNGVAEYVIDKLGVETIELKWGQGAKCIGGEIKVNSLERAIELKKRGYIVTPDPEVPAFQAAFKAGPLKQFERHSRLGFIDQEGFMAEVARLRKLGAKRITLKTGAYPMRELAMAIRWSSDAKIDLLTIDGAPGGTGMSPWRMMCEWGVPAIYLHSMAYEMCDRLAQRGKPVPDIAFAGGFSSEDHVFKALALGAPYCKAVCMGRALMIPGMVGKNTERWLRGEEGGLPSTVSKFGSTKEEIFMNYEVLKEKYGSEADSLPLGAVGIFSAVDKIKVGLQQIMAGSRNWKVKYISRDDLFSLSEECASVTGIPYVMNSYREEALKIIDA
jgi:glutamate synthase domain-containing protein 2